jgi:hypothetical protein
MLVFPVMRVCCAFFGLDNKLKNMHGPFVKIGIFCRNSTDIQNNQILRFRVVRLVSTQYIKTVVK